MGVSVHIVNNWLATAKMWNLMQAAENVVLSYLSTLNKCTGKLNFVPISCYSVV